MGSLSGRLGWAINRCLQALILALLAVGVVTRRVGVVVNAAGAFGVTLLPAVLERDLRIDLHPAHALWVTAAATLHAVGVLGPYRSGLWWHALAHTASAALVAGTAYVSVSAIDHHVEGVALPPRFRVACTLLTTMAAGVLWEVLEFGVGAAGELLLGVEVLTQYGVADTMTDLVFNAAGAVIVAAFHTEQLRVLGATVAARLHRLRES